MHVWKLFLLPLTSSNSFNLIRSLAFLTWSWLLRQYLCTPAKVLSLLPPSVCFLSVFEFLQELFIHSHELNSSTWYFCLASSSLGCIAPEPGEGDPWISTRFLWPLIPSGSYPMVLNFGKQIPEEAKICCAKVQGIELAVCLPHCSEDLKLHVLWSLQPRLPLGFTSSSPSPCWWEWNPA